VPTAVQRSAAARARAEAPPELIARARHDRAAFGELYHLYFRRVYLFCALHSRTREEAEDLTAQTFERALAAIERYEERGRPFSAWLLRIAAHAAADRARHVPPRVVEAHEASAQEDASGTEPSQAEEWAEQWELASWLRTHVAALPDDQRRVVQLRFYDGRSVAEVAEQLGRSEGAVKQLLRRALTALRARIDEEARSDG
jgi:RNA polymerase sigma-70 factor (ECF subfamily)